VFIVLAGVAIAIVAPHAGPIFPEADTGPYASTPTPGFVWLYLAVFAVGLAFNLAYVLYDAIATARYGRTPGKKWMHIRPVTLEGAPLTLAHSLGRSASWWIASWVPWLGLLDPLCCLWDSDRQCLHDKLARTLVVND